MNISRVVAGMLCLAAIPLQAAEIRVTAASASAPALKELSKRFEQSSGHTLAIEYGILDALKKKLESGASFDLVVIPQPLAKKAAAEGKVIAGTQAVIARVGMAAAVKAGAPRPDISSVDAFKQTLLNAKSVTYPPAGLIGKHMAKVYETLGISEQMQGRVKALKTVEQVPQTLSAGEAQLGFAPSTVLSAARGIDVIGPFPAEMQSYIVLTAAISTKANSPEAAKAFIQYLASPDAQLVMKSRGFEVGMR